MEMSITHAHTGQVRTASGICFLAGIWLIISASVYTGLHASAAGWNSIIVGIIVAIFAAVHFYTPRSTVGLSWLNLLLGIWMIISPWIYGYTAEHGAFWNSIILGIIIVIFAFWSAVTTQPTEPPSVVPRV